MTPPNELKPETENYPLNIGTFRLDKVMEDQRLQTDLLGAVVGLPEMDELKVVANYLAVDNIDSNAGRFTVIIKGVDNTPLVFERKGARFVLDSDSEAALLKNPLFIRSAYLEGLRSDAKISKYFEDLADLIKDMPEDYLGNFFRTLGGKELNMRLFGGSVPDADLKALILSKKYMILAKLASKLDGVKSFGELAQKRHEVFDPVLMQINLFNKSVLSKNLEHKRRGEKWTRDEVDYQVMRPILMIGLESVESGRLLEQFSADIFDRVLSLNNPGSSEFNLGLSALANYSFYVSDADSAAMDKIDYANLTDPKSMDGLRRIQYCEDVQRELLRTFPRKNERIKRFSEWKDVVDTSGVRGLEHDISKRKSPTDLTPLESSFSTVFKARMEKMKLMDGIKYSELQKLYDEVFTAGADNKSQASMEMDAVAGKSGQLQLAYIQSRVKTYANIVLIGEEYWIDVTLMGKAKIAWKELFSND